MQQQPSSYSESQHYIESTLLPLDPDPVGPETEKLGIVSVPRTSTTLVPGIEIPEEVLCGGVESVLNYILPKGTMNILVKSREVGPQRTMQLLNERIQQLLLFENLSKIEIAKMVYWMKKEESWRRLPGGSTYRSFREFVEYSGFPLSWKRVDEHIKFFQLFCQCVEAHIAPDPLLAPIEVSPYKHALVTEQMKGMNRQVDDLIQQWGPDSPKVDVEIDRLRGAISKEMVRIMETPDTELKRQEDDRHYKPDEEALPILPIYAQVHLQKEAFICDSASIPLTRDAIEAWEVGHVDIKVLVHGLDAMTKTQFKEYLEENDLFITSPVVDADEELLL